jgi:hypothetical protein
VTSPKTPAATRSAPASRHKAAGMPGPLLAPHAGPGAPSVQGSPTRGTEGAQTWRRPSWRAVPDCPLPRVLALQAAHMSEDTGPDSIEAHLRRYLTDLHLPLAYHPWREHAKRAREGWLDWAIAGDGGYIMRELKRQSEKPTAAQEMWLDTLEHAGEDVGVWKPCCVLSGRMARELAVVAGIGGS